MATSADRNTVAPSAKFSSFADTRAIGNRALAGDAAAKGLLEVEARNGNTHAQQMLAQLRDNPPAAAPKPTSATLSDTNIQALSLRALSGDQAAKTMLGIYADQGSALAKTAMDKVNKLPATTPAATSKTPAAPTTNRVTTPSTLGAPTNSLAKGGTLSQVNAPGQTAPAAKGGTSKITARGNKPANGPKQKADAAQKVKELEKRRQDYASSPENVRRVANMEKEAASRGMVPNVKSTSPAPTMDELKANAEKARKNKAEADANQTTAMKDRLERIAKASEGLKNLTDPKSSFLPASDAEKAKVMKKVAENINKEYLDQYSEEHMNGKPLEYKPNQLGKPGGGGGKGGNGKKVRPIGDGQFRKF